MMNIEFSYQITKKDFIDYYKIMLYEKKGKWMYDKLPYLLLITFLFFLLVLIQPKTINLTILFVLVTMLLTFFILTPILIIYYAKKTYKEMPFVNYQHQYTINEDGIRIQTKYQSTYTKWIHLQMLKESKYNFYCIFKSNHILIIPKNKINCETFISYIKEKFPHLQNHLLKQRPPI